MPLLVPPPNMPYKSKGTISRRNRTSSYVSFGNKESISVDAILTRNTSISPLRAESSIKTYLVNCLSAIQQPLLGHAVATNYANNLNSAIATHISDLADKEVDGTLRNCDLLNKISYIQNSTIDDKRWPLAKKDDLSPPAFAKCLRNFFGLVTETGGFLPKFDQLQVPKLPSDAHILVAELE